MNSAARSHAFSPEEHVDVDALDDEPTFEVQLSELTTVEKLGLYAIYREGGGDPYEPEESQLKARQASPAE
jgi:hypothetical protein